MSDEETITPVEPQENGAPGSLQAYILGGIKAKQTATVQKIPVPRFEGRLVVRYHSLPSRELIRISMVAQKYPDEATATGAEEREVEQAQVEGLIQASVTALLESCEGCETTIDGVTHDLGVKLGLGLSRMLGEAAECDGAANDREAVFLIFQDEADIVTCANKLRQFQALANARSADDMVGNSGAVS
jgi:hypothetical protein